MRTLVWGQKVPSGIVIKIIVCGWTFIYWTVFHDVQPEASLADVLLKLGER
jgi:hypothetical protein